MKCLICKHGETEQGFTTVTLEKNGSTIVFKHVDGHISAELLKKWGRSWYS